MDDLTPTLHAISTALGNLAAAGSADAAAAKLVAEGITARPLCAEQCILVEYITRHVDLTEGLYVTVHPKSRYGGLVAVRRRGDHWLFTKGALAEVALPGVLGVMATRFDMGRYPELVARPYRYLLPQLTPTRTRSSELMWDFLVNVAGWVGGGILLFVIAATIAGSTS